MTLKRDPLANTPALFVVVHQVTPEHALEQTRIALGSGANGVFLINHYTPDRELLDAVRLIRETLGSDPWLGINPLGLGALQAVQTLRASHIDDQIDGLWCDNAGIVESFAADEQRYAREVWDRLKGWDGAYFGGVAFKYQLPVEDYLGVAYSAALYMDVVCTSGPGTGKSINIEKLKTMAEGAHACYGQIAVASGISLENVDEHLDYIDAGLVATSVSLDETTLDPVAIEALAEKFKAWQA